MVEIVLVQDNTPEAYARLVLDLEQEASCGKYHKPLSTSRRVLLTSKLYRLPCEKAFLMNLGQISKSTSPRQVYTKRQLNFAALFGSCRTSSSNATSYLCG